MANPGGKNQYGGPYKGALAKNSAKKAAKSGTRAVAKSVTSGGGGSSSSAPRRPSDAELRELARTPAGRRQIREMQRQNENRLSAPARNAARRAGFTGGKPKGKRRK